MKRFLQGTLSLIAGLFLLLIAARGFGQQLRSPMLVYNPGTYGYSTLVLVDTSSFKQFPLARTMPAIESMTSAVWSPDGSTLVFVGGTDDLADDNERYRRDLFAFDLNRLETRALTTNTDAELNPSWSGDGRQLAYTIDGVGFRHVHVLDMASLNTYQVTSNRFVNDAPIWLPGGEYLAYMSYAYWNETETHRSTLNVVNPETGESWFSRELGLTFNIDLALAPDGERLVYSLGGHLFLLNLTTNAVTDLQIQGQNPVWSPDGSKLVYTSLYSVADGTRAGMYVMDWATQRQQYLIFAENCAAWSPDSEWIATMVLNANSTETLHLIHVDSGKTVNLQAVAPAYGNSGCPVWMPQ